MTASSALPSGTEFVPRGDLPRRIHQIIEPWAHRQAEATGKILSNQLRQMAATA